MWASDVAGLSWQERSLTAESLSLKCMTSSWFSKQGESFTHPRAYSSYAKTWQFSCVKYMHPFLWFSTHFTPPRHWIRGYIDFLMKQHSIPLNVSSSWSLVLRLNKRECEHHWLGNICGLLVTSGLGNLSVPFSPPDLADFATDGSCFTDLLWREWSADFDPKTLHSDYEAAERNEREWKIPKTFPL